MTGVRLSLRQELGRELGRDPEAPAPADLRLAFGAVAAWIATIGSLSHTAGRTTVWAGLAFLLGVVALRVGRRRTQAGHDRREDRATQIAIGLAFAAFCVAAVLAPLAARLARIDDSPVARLARAGADVIAEVKLDGDPRLLAGQGVAGGSRMVVDASLIRVRAADHDVAQYGSVVIFGATQDWSGLLPGQRVRVEARLQPPKNDGLVVAIFIAQSAPLALGDPPWWQRGAGVVRSSLSQAASGLSEGPRGLLPGLVDGDTSNLDPVLAEHFRVAGLTHLVAVSGTNCAILVGVVLLGLRRLRLGPVTCGVMAGVVLVGFVVIARPSPSVLRAAAMAVIALIALAVGRPRSALPALSVAVLVLLVYDPSLAVDVGFTMSVTATAALLLIAPGWAAALRARRVPPVLAEALAVAAAAHVVTAPIIAALSGRISVVAIPANILAEPVVAVATVVGFAAALVAPLSLGLGSMLAQVAGLPCRWLVWVASFFGELQGATVPWPTGVMGAALLVILAAGCTAAARHGLLRRMLAAALVVGVIVQIPVRTAIGGWPVASAVLVACDVGQGDGLVLPTGPGRAIVVDTGPDPVAMDRCLHDLRVTSVSVLVFTHLHQDHVGGISGVFHGRRVGEVLTGPLSEPSTGLQSVTKVLLAHGLTLGRTTSGEAIDDGNVHLDVLGPPVAFRGTRSDPNNSSVILRATTAGRRILLMGDAEVEAQQQLLDDGVDLQADVLKVAHHGSAYSVPALLAAVHAQVAVISVGLGNDYGLPSPLLISELTRLGIPICRTDQSGDIAVTVTNGQLATVQRGVAASTAA